MLSDRERRELCNFRMAKRRREWLAGRLAIKRAVADLATRHGRASRPLRQIEVSAVASGRQRGRPFVGLPYHVSLSHSGGLAVAVASTSQVGIDVERIRDFRAAALGAAFTPAERARLLARPPQVRRTLATRWWTVKEALLKSAGVGLRFDARNLELIEVSNGPLRWRTREALPELPASGAIDGHGIVGDYAFCVCWPGTPNTPSVQIAKGSRS